ncbi:LexA family protein [Erwinia sp. V71]|uniref:LexA family protein n=1 Tax=Erwinia sp. V71 TaxID=3369424 RepID=UPI003F5FD2BD
MSLATRVKSRRLELGLSQEKAAEAAGIKQQTWQAIEDGTTMKPRNIVGIAKALKTDPAWLVDGGPMMPVADVNTRRVPLISYVQAGNLAHGKPVESMEDVYEYILTDAHLSESAFALKLKGDSMEPEFKDGDVIIVDPEIEPNPGEFVVAANGDFDATFKKYRPLMSGSDEPVAFELLPLNSDYPVLTCRDGKVKIIGTMIEHRIYRRKR